MDGDLSLAAQTALVRLFVAVGQLLDGPTDDHTDRMDEVIAAYDDAKSHKP